MKLGINTLTYYIGWILFPSCVLLCLAEFLYYMDTKRKEFYYINSLKWFIHQEKPQEVVRAMLIFLLTTIFIAFMFFTFAASAAEWSSIYSKEVHPNQSIILDNITIDNIQFSSAVTGHMSNGKLVLDYPVDPRISFEVHSIDSHGSSLLGNDETYTNNNMGIKITASRFTAPDSILWEYASYNPSAILSIYQWTQDYPELKITIKPQYSIVEYGKYSSMNINSEIKNTGKSSAYVDISPVFDYLSSISTDTKRQITISPGTTQNVEWSIDIPQRYGNHTIEIIAEITKVPVYNPDGTYINKTLRFSSSSEIQITEPRPNINIQKIVPSRLYTCINTSIILVASNDGIFDIKNITITDNVPESFAAASDIFRWNIPELKSGTQISLFERMMPTKEGSFNISAAGISYTINQQFSTLSNISTTQVISTGKSCPKESVSISNIQVDTSSISIEPIKVEQTPIPTQTVQKTIPSPTPVPTPTSIPISLIGFELPIGILMLLAAYKATR